MNSVPHPCAFFLAHGWESTKAWVPTLAAFLFLRHRGPRRVNFARWGDLGWDTTDHCPVFYNLTMSFPVSRMRRLRRTESLRALVRETAVTPGDLIYPLFLCPGKGVRRPVGSMPGVFNLSIDEAVREAEEMAAE